MTQGVQWYSKSERKIMRRQKAQERQRRKLERYVRKREAARQQDTNKG